MKEVDSKAPERSSMQELKDEDEWTDKEIKASEGNHKALNALYASMSIDEKKRVQNCVTAKQAWEMELDEDERPKSKNSKNIALKVTEPSKSKSEDSEHDEILFDNFSQRKYEYGSSSNNNKKCYTCGGIGHIATDCGNKKTDSGNKAYKTSWSDDDDSSTKRDKAFALVSSFSLDYASFETEGQEEDEDNSYEDNEMFEYQARVLLDGTNTKVEKFQHSSKSLSDILSSGKSYNDRTGLGYTGSKECEKYIEEHVESENLQTSFKSNIVNSNDRYEEDIQDIQSKLKEHSQLLLDISRFVSLSKSYKESKQDADMVRRHSDYESNDIKVACNVAITALSARQEDTWYIDSGCSRHMCGNKHWFSDLEESGVTGAVTFGDGKKAKIRGKGSIRSQDLNCLNNVLYVEGLSNNLISVSQLVDEYEDVWFNKRRCVVFDKDGTVVMGGVRSGDNYYHVASNLKSDNSESCFRTSSVEETMEL
ncbi:uncharacterized protein LOC126795774 [Argentina anserina]|uniref:uncharacterized protein LOC126795774 n=1 Tax=Argentina anserina TaxID=57926 RepID=UPI00217674C7|nr:uncharacterized protein LOC126795774 [Potentilla anserina]